MNSPMVIALLGAESTGKSTLAAQLASALSARGHAALVVPEYLRECCDLNGRVPVVSEQFSIALQQTKRIAAVLTEDCTVVIADTTALMTAVYSDYLFADKSLYGDAFAAQKNYDLTLLMGLDMPWVADGLQRDGPHVREAVDSLVREALQRAEIQAPTIYGLGELRLQAALDVTLQALQAPPSARREPIKKSKWQHFCENCGDGDCERRMLTLLAHG
jgi:nicotinamide riboside kinase